MQSNSEVLCCEGRRDKIFITTPRATACYSGLKKLRFCNYYRGRPLSFLNAPSLSHCSLSLKRKHARPGKLDDKQKRLEANQQVQQMFFLIQDDTSKLIYIVALHVSKTSNPTCQPNFKWNESMMHDSTLQCTFLGIMDDKHGTQNDCLGPFYGISLAPSPMAFHWLPRCQSPIQ